MRSTALDLPRRQQERKLKQDLAVSKLEAADELMDKAAKVAPRDQTARDITKARMELRTALAGLRDRLGDRTPSEALEEHLRGWLERWRRWENDPDEPLRPAPPKAKAEHLAKLLGLEAGR